MSNQPTTVRKPSNPNGSNAAAPSASPMPAPVGDSDGLVFSTQAQYTTHLFYLKNAMFKKNVAIDEQTPEYENTEHVHWYHTVDSSGKHLLRSNSVGGHFHVMEVIDQGPGKRPLVRCASGPMKEIKQKIGGKRVVKEVPFNDVDHHIHDVEYRRSNVILERTRNVEAAKAEAAIAARFNRSVAGVDEGE